MLLTWHIIMYKFQILVTTLKIKDFNISNFTLIYTLAVISVQIIVKLNLLGLNYERKREVWMERP